MADEAEKLPQHYGRYILFETLGTSGMAEVYKARLANSGGPDRVLVVKLPNRSADSAACSRFVHEAKVALPLTHGNITATFEFGHADDRPFLVMEYVHGRSLRHVLNRLEKRGETLQAATGLFLAREVARALRYAHRFVDVTGRPSPVVHRDVSPGNILLSFAGQVKLTDFGIARSEGNLASDVPWGKPAYVAPEILEGDGGTPESDIYSLGCVVYEMLSGVPPLLGRTEKETLALVRAWVPEPLNRLRTDLPRGVSDLVACMLDKTPDRRQVDAAELEVRLTRFLTQEAPHFTETNLAYTINHLFGGEPHQDSSGEAVVLADRLRAQLRKAGVATTGNESAEDILAMGTVQLCVVRPDDTVILPRPADPASTEDAAPLAIHSADTVSVARPRREDHSPPATSAPAGDVNPAATVTGRPEKTESSLGKASRRHGERNGPDRAGPKGNLPRRWEPRRWVRDHRRAVLLLAAVTLALALFVGWAISVLVASWSRSAASPGGISGEAAAALVRGDKPARMDTSAHEAPAVLAPATPGHPSPPSRKKSSL